MCNASGTSYQRIHVFGVPILTHQETMNGNSDRVVVSPSDVSLVDGVVVSGGWRGSSVGAQKEQETA